MQKSRDSTFNRILYMALKKHLIAFTLHGCSSHVIGNEYIREKIPEKS